MMPPSNNACIELMPEKVATITGLRGMFRTVGASWYLDDYDDSSSELRPCGRVQGRFLQLRVGNDYGASSDFHDAGGKGKETDNVELRVPAQETRGGENRIL